MIWIHMPKVYNLYLQYFDMPTKCCINIWESKADIDKIKLELP